MTDNVAAVKRKAVAMLLDMGYIGVIQKLALDSGPTETTPTSGEIKSSGGGSNGTPPPAMKSTSETGSGSGGEGSTSGGSKTSNGSDQDYEFVNHDDAAGQGLGR